MRHDYIDRYSYLDSPVHKIDPRVKLIVVFLCIAILASESGNNIVRFVPYYLLCIFVAAISRVPPVHILKRFLVVSPFIFMASLFMPLSHLLTPAQAPGEALTRGAAIFCRASLAVFLLILLTATEKFHKILLGMRLLKIPRLVGVLAALMYRYLFVFSDEVLKTTRARMSRTPGKLKTSLLTVYGRQMAVIFLKSWDRSNLLYKSMISRGFNGEFPCIETLSPKFYDIFWGSAFVLTFLASRLWRV